MSSGNWLIPSLSPWYLKQDNYNPSELGDSKRNVSIHYPNTCKFPLANSFGLRDLIWGRDMVEWFQTSPIWGFFKSTLNEVYDFKSMHKPFRGVFNLENFFIWEFNQDIKSLLKSFSKILRYSIKNLKIHLRSTCFKKFMDVKKLH